MMKSSQPQTDTLLAVLAEGEMQVEGEFLWGSNYTYLAHVSHGSKQALAVYKPTRGERPLWDFPPQTLAFREVAAYLTSRTLGWDLVPPTVLRDDGPSGPGSLQLFVDADPERHYFTFTQAEKQRLRPLALFDVVINNADRKGGHVLLSPDGHLWSIDHGVCFHAAPKLRTVIWDFEGESIPAELLSDLQAFHDRLIAEESLHTELGALLQPDEMQALISRLAGLLQVGVFPSPGPGRPYPWPLV